MSSKWWAGQARTFGVEEELLVVDATTLLPVGIGKLMAASFPGSLPTGHQVSTELKQEQIEVAGPPHTTFMGQLDAIRAGRAAADRAAAAFGGRVAALSTSPWPLESTTVAGPRTALIEKTFEMTAAEQLTCGMHVHVGINSPQEGVDVLDRLRGWLPVILALSANSPYWMGKDSGFASYRYQAWSRWPTSGPTDLFGTTAAYERQRRELLGSGVPLDDGMLYYDARLSARYPTVEVRIADICLLAEHAAAIAALIRALVDTCASQADKAPAPIPTAVLRAWSWRSSRYGITEDLVDPVSRTLAPAATVCQRLLDFVTTALADNGELEPVAAQLQDMMRNGTGASRQRSPRPERHELNDDDARAVVDLAVAATHSIASPTTI